MNFTAADLSVTDGGGSSGGGSGGATTAARALKRGSDGAAHCVCRGSCSTKMCGCVKGDKGCSPTCRCQPELCKNRRLSSDSEDKENNVSHTSLTCAGLPQQLGVAPGRYRLQINCYSQSSDTGIYISSSCLSGRHLCDSQIVRLYGATFVQYTYVHNLWYARHKFLFEV